MFVVHRRLILTALVTLVCLLPAVAARAQDPAPVPVVIGEPPTPTPDVLAPTATPDPAAAPIAPTDGVTDVVPTAAVEIAATPLPPEPTAAPPEDTDPQGRVVQPGETLETISAQVGFTVGDLAQANALTRGDLLLAGQKVRFPSAAVSQVALTRVRRGESLFRLAVRQRMSPFALREMNALACNGCLIPGQVLRVPSPDADGAASNIPHLIAPFTSVTVGPFLPRQGDVISVSVRTVAPMQGISGTLAGRALNFVQKDDAYVALSGVAALQNPGVYTLTLTGLDSAGTPIALEGRFQVSAGRFAFENLTVGPKLVPLLDIDVNLEERAALDTVFNSNFTGAQYWSGPLELPISGRIISFYGTRRNFNRGTLNTFHSGIDVPARVGTPVGASAPGTVAATKRLPIRGNVVILDHGRGVFTIYCHLSKFNVKEGDVVDTGEVIGFTGNTGRSLGPHLHFELAVGGVTVNPLAWLDKTLP
jgi:murein DD-endopeptidase MepM/ murein hydrolase activator NlpD